jgi:hypothetical protein
MEVLLMILLNDDRAQVTMPVLEIDNLDFGNLGDIAVAADTVLPMSLSLYDVESKELTLAVEQHNFHIAWLDYQLNNVGRPATGTHQPKIFESGNKLKSRLKPAWAGALSASAAIPASNSFFTSGLPAEQLSLSCSFNRFARSGRRYRWQARGLSSLVCDFWL